MDKLSLHGLTQYYVKLEEGQKTRKLTDLMDILGIHTHFFTPFLLTVSFIALYFFFAEFNQVVIFVRDKRRCATLNKILQENKFPAIELHSDMSVEDR